MADEQILIVEDETPMRRFLVTTLRAHGFRTLEADSARAALVEATTHVPDLLLLDLGLPDRDGLSLVREIRGWSRVPIVVVSARGREADKVEALDLGADDYLTKPFGTAELLARIRVALRHRPTATEEEPTLRFGHLEIDQARREVRSSGELVHLTPTEYKLLLLLARNPGKVLTHRQILQEVWGTAYASQTHYVRVQMAELRKKVEVDPARPKLLITEPGVGYRLRDA